MLEPTSHRLTLLAYVAGATTAFLLSLLGYQQWDAARWEEDVRAHIQQSTDRSRAVADYLSSLRDIETGQRGFLVTNDPAYLQPFQKAQADLPRQATEVRAAFAGAPQTRALADDLLTTGKARAERATATVMAMRQGGVEAARSLVVQGIGKQLMDRARQIEDRIEKIELGSFRSLLSASLAERRDRQRIIYTTQIATLLCLAVLLFALTRIVGGMRRSAVTLRDAATRQTAIFEGGTDAMMMLDARGCIENANSATEKLFGHPARELIGQSNLVLFDTPPPEEVSHAYLQRLAAGHLADNRQMFVGRCRNGGTVEVEVVTTPIRLEDGLHFLAVARDATERREMERMKDEFVATVSHELRTPLTSIAGSLGLILGGAAGEISDKASRLVQIAHNNCGRLVRLINDMLDIEKIESGKVQLALQPIGLASSVEQAVTSLAGFADQHGVAIMVETIPAEWQVIADPDRLAQIITNLASNAVKFSPWGGVVTIAAAPSASGRTRVSVRDQGPGISAEFKSRIFQKFAQADSTDSRQKGGTGLGLSIVKELAERMGGRAGFTSVEGEGSTFYVDLPAVERAPIPEPPAQQLGRLGDEGVAQILHVDDDSDTLRVVSSAFEGRASVLSSPSLEEAKAALERYAFDAIILDIAMPDGNGLDLIDFANGRDGPSAPVILYTALDASPEGEPKVFARLTKSKVSLARLVRTVEKAVGAKA